jgi:hypothetical protein
MLKEHSSPDPDSPPQQKGPNKKPLYVNNRKLPIFQVPCPSLGAAFPISLINPTLCAKLVVPQVNLPHEPILWPVKARTLDTTPQHIQVLTRTDPAWLLRPKKIGHIQGDMAID